MPHVYENQTFRTALRAALVPAGLYLLVAAPVSALVYATEDVKGQVPGPVAWLTALVSLFLLCMLGWVGYRAMQWTRRRSWAVLSGLLVAVLLDAVVLLPGVVIEASQNAGLTASSLSAALAHNAIRIGLDCLLGAAAAWFGSL